jgi:hypothetical protein
MVVDLGKCGCENCSCKEARDHNTCDECHESHKESNIEKFMRITFTTILFWHLLLHTILVQKIAFKKAMENFEELFNDIQT